VYNLDNGHVLLACFRESKVKVGNLYLTMSLALESHLRSAHDSTASFLDYCYFGRGKQNRSFLTVCGTVYLALESHSRSAHEYTSSLVYHCLFSELFMSDFVTSCLLRFPVFRNLSENSVQL
jgi:hypothetical protein